jgi:tetratricopeptide (TPR) repeat protein
VTRTGTAAAALAAFVSWLIVCSASVASAEQDLLVHAKDLYTSAAYDEALAALTTYQAPPDHVIEADEYRAFCLLALGRNADASKIIEEIVTADPSFLPAENQASPRVREAFRDVRQRVLPAIVRKAYADAKTSFDRKDFETATRQFDRVLTLLKDPAAAGSGDLADVRTLSNGFLDLMKTAATSPRPIANAPSAPPTPRVYSAEDEDVSPPVVVSQILPAWRPLKQETQTYEVALVLLINETGSVDSFRVEGNLYPSYNTQLREAVRHWKYRPAMKDGVPVKFGKVVRIRLSPSEGSQSAAARR